MLKIYSEIVPATPLDLSEDEYLHCQVDGEQKYLHPGCDRAFCLFCEDACPECGSPTI